MPVSSRTQFIINSSTPPKHDALQLVYPCSFQTYVFPGSETPTFIESLYTDIFKYKLIEIWYFIEKNELWIFEFDFYKISKKITSSTISWKGYRVQSAIIENLVDCEQQLPWIGIFIPISHRTWLHNTSFDLRCWSWTKTIWIVVQRSQCLWKFQKYFATILFRSGAFTACHRTWRPMRILDKTIVFTQMKKKQQINKSLNVFVFFCKIAKNFLNKILTNLIVSRFKFFR